VHCIIGFSDGYCEHSFEEKECTDQFSNHQLLKYKYIHRLNLVIRESTVIVKEIGLGVFGGFKHFQHHRNTKKLFLEYHL
jgi:hypothetical protein